MREVKRGTVHKEGKAERDRASALSASREAFVGGFGQPESAIRLLPELPLRGLPRLAPAFLPSELNLTDDTCAASEQHTNIRRKSIQEWRKRMMSWRKPLSRLEVLDAPLFVPLSNSRSVYVDRLSILASGTI